MPAFLRKYFLVILFLTALSVTFISPTFAQNLGQLTPTPGVGSGPTDLTTCAKAKANWQPDQTVTEVGKGADRARQFLYWVFSKDHQPIDNAPIIVQMWAISRNIVYIFVVLVIVAFGFSYIFLRRRAMSINIPPILLKVGGVLLFTTFSYVLVLGLIQGGEILTRFFVEKVGGQDLFNVIFAGVNSDKNYINFIGYRDMNFCSGESANTSMLLIRLTTFTYNVMGVMMILRKIILWFLLILSPFLALLMPFVFIRNIGWIWIGVFFQWLFYGPLLALFLASITRIWVAGIPYAFNFSKVNKPEGQVYRTSINILYGGPAQTLSPGNSGNYVDTYAEYVIALVMLWAAIVLPWWLLRIFRDYCCAAIEASRATLTAIFDRLRQYPPPREPTPSTPTPTTTAGMAFDLPFRKNIEQMKKDEMREVRNIERAATQDIAMSMNMSVSSLADLGRLEMDQSRMGMMQSTLQKISNPQAVASSEERERYTSVRNELVDRATRGDKIAQNILTASSSDRTQQVMAVPTIGSIKPSVPATQKAVGVSPVHVAGKALPQSVSVEDYEEVKKMWLTHYRKAPVPVSEKIKGREEWLSEDTKNLTNVINLLSSPNQSQRQKGLSAVASLLPFLLLGGYSDVETITYLRAKLEAAKQIQSELEAAAKVREEVKAKREEDEDTLIEVSGKKQEEVKHMEDTAKLTMDPSDFFDKSQDKSSGQAMDKDQNTTGLPKEEKKV